VSTKILSFKVFKNITTDRLKAVIPYLGLISVYIVFGLIAQNKFLNVKNLLRIINQSVVIMIVGTGVSFVISMGSLDFSPGASAALSAALGAHVIGMTNNAVLGFLTIIVFALTTGLLIGILLTKFKVPSFVLTLSVLFMYRGLAIMACMGGSIPIPLWMRVFDSFIIKFVVLVVAFAVFYYIFTFTKIGIYCRAIGSNEVAANYAGVSVNKIKILAFMISGLLTGVGACVLLVRSGGVSTRFGIFLEVDVLTALVLGGLPLTGGNASKMRSIIIGSFLFMALSNGLLLVGTSDKILQFFKGALFLIMVALSFERKNLLVIK